MPVEALLTLAPTYSSQWMAVLVAALPQIIIDLPIFTLIYARQYTSIPFTHEAAFLMKHPRASGDAAFSQSWWRSAYNLSLFLSPAGVCACVG